MWNICPAGCKGRDITSLILPACFDADNRPFLQAYIEQDWSATDFTILNILLRTRDIINSDLDMLQTVGAGDIIKTLQRHKSTGAGEWMSKI